jgi:hypothetical protein
MSECLPVGAPVASMEGKIVPDIPPAVDLMTLTAPNGAPSLAEAAKRLHVELSDMDASFGVVPVDPDHGLYAVQVRAGRAQKQSEAADFHGPWSNPAIAPFGPVQDGTGPDENKR